jgi:hypothetical protein
MRPRGLRFTLPFAALLLGAGLASAAPLQDELRTLWRIGRFDAAREVVAATLAARETNPVVLESAAEAAFELRDYASAAELYAQLAAQYQGRPADYLRTKRREWESRRGADPSSGAAWIGVAGQAVDTVLNSTARQRGPNRQLALELQQALHDLTQGAAMPGDELRQDYPDSDTVLRAAKDAANAISTETDDKQRIALIRRFLEDYPRCYWRHLAYRYWLYAAWRLGSTAALEAAAKAYLGEYPGSPQALGAVSRYFFDSGYDLKRGRSLGEQSVNAYERELGTDGSMRSLRQLDNATRGLPLSADHLPPGRRAQFMDYLGSRFNLARYYVKENSPIAALNQVNPVIDAAPFSTEDDETAGPFYYVAAQAKEQQKDTAEAFRNYLGAAIFADSRQRYSIPAAEKLSELSKDVLDVQQRAFIEQYTGPALQGVPLPRFTDMTNQVGLKGIKARRAAWGDIDGDGDQDLLLDGRQLFVYNQSTGFRDASRDSGIARNASGGVFGDYDNDGDSDLYCFGSGRHGDALYRNDNGHFTDMSSAMGNPVDSYPSEAAVWLDYDRDGLLDLYTGNFQDSQQRDETARTLGEPNLLYHNTGGSAFRVVLPREAGMTPPFGENLPARGVTAGDINGDAWPDLFVGDYRLQENLLWVNAGAGKFDNKARMLGVAGAPKLGYWGHTLGSAFGDVDNDGDLDLFSCNLAPERYLAISDKSQLLMNGAGSETLFADQRSQRGIRYAETNCDPVFADFNNDGYLDLYFTANYAGRPSFLYLNDGKGNFHDVTFLATARVSNSWGVAVADYDQDGRLDLIAASPEGVRLLHNETPAQSWVAFRLIGGSSEARAPAADGLPWSNAQCIGARISLHYGTEAFVREVQAGRGIGSCDAAVASFGLGARKGLVHINIRYPSGREWTSALKDLNGTYTFHEKDAVAAAAPAATDDNARGRSGRVQ